MAANPPHVKTDQITTPHTTLNAVQTYKLMLAENTDNNAKNSTGGATAWYCCSQRGGHQPTQGIPQKRSYFGPTRGATLFPTIAQIPSSSDTKHLEHTWQMWPILGRGRLLRALAQASEDDISDIIAAQTT